MNFPELTIYTSPANAEDPFKDGFTLVPQFTPINLHFHTPSEHTINGLHFDLEMHIVHKSQTDAPIDSVLAVLFNVTTDKNISCTEEN